EIDSEVRIAEPVLRDRPFHGDLPAQVIQHGRRVMSRGLRRQHDGREGQRRTRHGMLSVSHYPSSAVYCDLTRVVSSQADRLGPAAIDHSATGTNPSLGFARPERRAPLRSPRDDLSHKLTQQSIQIPCSGRVAYSTAVVPPPPGRYP